MFITDDVPIEVKEYESSPLREYGYIKDDSFTDEKIEYATQASEVVHISSASSYVCKAFMSQYNYTHVEQCLYVSLPLGTKNKLQSSSEEECFDVMVNFEVKHSYFDRLQHAVVKLPPYVISCLLPDEESISNLEMKFKPPQWLEYHFMKLDDDKQAKALKMITSVSLHTDNRSCPPPVILYGPFGSGKTRILARAAYEIMTNRIETRILYIRILICAHHPQSVNSFIVNYFARCGNLPFDVFLVGNPHTSRNSSYHKTLDELHKSVVNLKNVIIVTSYSTSLNLYDIFNVPDYGYFTHVFLDEAAQVREPEAIIPLALATRDAKIVLAGDDKQV